MAKGMFCGQCGARIEAGDRFCGECGAPIQAQEAKASESEAAAAPENVSPQAKAKRFRPGSTHRIRLVLGILLLPVVLFLIWVGLRELGDPGMVSAMAISPDGRILATGGHGGYVMVWRLPDMKLVTRFHHGNDNLTIENLQFGSKGERLAVDNDKTIVVYNLSGGQARKTFEVVDTQNDDSTYAGLCLDGTTLYGVLSDGLLKAWHREKNWSDIPTGSDLTNEIDVSKFVWHGPLAFSPDCRRLVVSYRSVDSQLLGGAYIGLYDVAEGSAPGQMVLRLKGMAEKSTFGLVTDLAFLGDGKTFASIDHYNVFTSWDFNNPDKIKTIQLSLLGENPRFVVDTQKNRAIVSWPLGYGAFKSIDLESGSVVENYTHGPLWYRLLMALEPELRKISAFFAHR